MSENTFSIVRYSGSGHLAFDTVYYVESKQKEDLNKVMNDIEHSGYVLFANAELQPFPFKLHCLSQEELAPENLRARMANNYEEHSVAEAIDSLRDCLAADKGGVLTARCLPNQDEDADNGHCDLCTCEKFGSIRPEESLKTLQSFARFAAQENFQRLSGTSYSTFLRAKDEALHPRRQSNSTMSFIVAYPDPKEIISKMNSRLQELSSTIDGTADYYDMIDILEKDLKSLKDKVKYNKPFMVEVQWSEIKVAIQGKKEKVRFGRGDVADTLYIFFLRQLERAHCDSNILPYISQNEMEKYSAEITAIYQRISGKDPVGINSVFLKSTESNDFANAVSSIRKFFKNEFNVETLRNDYGKCYSIEIMDKDRYGNPRYGIQLDVEDFDLGRFSIDAQRI